MAKSLGDLPPKQQWAGVAGICVLLMGIYYMQFWRPNAAQTSQLGNEIAALRAEVQATQAIAVNLPELRDQMAALDTRLEILSHILPEEFETAELLRGVQTIAAQSNLSIRDLAFRDPVPHEFYAESPIELEPVQPNAIDHQATDLVQQHDRTGLVGLQIDDDLHLSLHQIGTIL